MAKNPVLPLYYNDIDRSTRTWTDEEFGAYMRLLIEQWDKGGLPKDYQKLTRLCTSLDTTWAMIKDKFPEADGMLKNPVMEEIREKRAKHSEKQAENVRNRYQKSTKPITKNTPLENEYENEIEDINIKIKSALDLALDDITLETLSMQWSKSVDFPKELQAFRTKVTLSPRVYATHDTDGLRMAFQAQLRNAKPLKPTDDKRKPSFKLSEIP